MSTYSFENIIAWKKAHHFRLLVYSITRSFPDDERFGLTSQFRRAAVSIGANIAEGYKKLSNNIENCYRLKHTIEDLIESGKLEDPSKRTIEECRDYIILAKDLEYIDLEQFKHLHDCLEEASKLLTAYCRGIINNNGIKDII